MDAKEYVSQIRYYDRIIENTISEIRHYRELAGSAGGVKFDDVRVQGTRLPDRMENTIIKYTDMENELAVILEDASRVKRNIIRTIELLPVSEYDLLHKVYVQGKTLQITASESCMSYSWATTTHSRALAHLQQILDERETDINDCTIQAP